jgi:hypothetical protein
MSLFRRNRGAREETAEPGAETLAAEPDAAAIAAAPEEPTAVQPGPAELDALVGEVPGTRRRGRLRRRLRHLRRVREVLLRDLGGLTFELHRSGTPDGGTVMDGKLARLAGVDAEIRELESRLDDHRAMVVREPGIGGTCAECGELFGSEARYCWACGHPVAAGAGGAPHLAAWTTHPQLTEGSWVDQPTGPLELTDQPTAPMPQLDPDAVEAVAPAPNEPATVDVGSEAGSAETVESTAEPEPAPEPEPAQPHAWLPAESPAPEASEATEAAPPLSSGDPLAPRQVQP